MSGTRRPARPLWKFEYPTDYEDLYGYDNGPRCSPVVDGDRVYIFGAEGMLHCLTSADGKLLWKVDTPTKFGVDAEFLRRRQHAGRSRGIADRARSAAARRRARACLPASSTRWSGNGSGIVAFDKLTGEVRYKISDELASYSSPMLATIDGRRWCFVFARGGLVGFEPANGKIDFQFPWRAAILESVNASNPVVVGNSVFISETYGPGSALLRGQAGRGTKSSGRSDKTAPRQSDADALEHAASTSTATCTAPAAGTPRTPSCAASSWRPAR